MKFMQGIVTLFAVAIMIEGCGESAESYSERVRPIADSILFYSAVAESVSDQYKTTWSDAIDSHYKDFNDELQKVHEEYEAKGTYARMKTGKSWIDSSMRTIAQPPAESQQVYQKVMDFYGKYSQFHELAMTPTGSLMSYRQQTSGLSSDMVKAMNELKVMNLLTMTDSKGSQ